MSPGVLSDLRKQYHRKLLTAILGRRPNSRAYSNADGNNELSISIAAGIADTIVSETRTRACRNPATAQKAGSLFTRFTKEFLDEAFQRLRHLRPGDWIFSTSQQYAEIAKFYQYEHLALLAKSVEENKQLKAALGGDYLITPDIIVAREPVRDPEINRKEKLVNQSDKLATYTPLRKAVNPTRILHASVSCKWTIRSDRAQNIRTEALNLIRHRKGHTPHVVAVTFEPLPSRIAAIALGTGDIDCTYHGALHELKQAVQRKGGSDSKELLESMIHGRRLRDISDLPFDLAT